MIDPALVQMLAIGFGLLFLASGARKLADFRAFAAAVAGYRLLPRRAAPVAAGGLLLAETGIGAGAVSFGSGFQLPALAACAGLLAGYAGAMAVNLLRGRRAIDCGCTASTARRAIGWDMVLRNLVLAGLAAGPAALPVGARALTWLDAVTIGGGAAILLIAYGCLEVVLALPRRAVRRPAS